MSRFPQRIVCLTEEPTEVLYALGEQQRIVGISGFTVRPPQARREKPRVSAFTSAKVDRILALQPDGCFAILEVKSCARDFLTDQKWPDYREFSDRLYFAVDLDFPQELLPQDAGLVVADGLDAALVREAPSHALAPARRRALLHRYAMLAASRLAALTDPRGFAELRAALRVE